MKVMEIHSTLIVRYYIEINPRFFNFDESYQSIVRQQKQGQVLRNFGSYLNTRKCKKKNNAHSSKTNTH